MTVNPNIGSHPQDEAVMSPNRVRVQLAGVTVDIELNPTDAAAFPPAASVAPVAPPAAVPAVPVATPTAPPTPPPAEPAFEAHHVRSPIVGTFYHAPEPGAAPFVAVGDTVTEGQQIGIVEAMKLMNPIEADRAGRVVEILVPDAAPVEYDQPLIAVEPQ